VISLTLLCALTPVLIGVAIAVKASSPGPIVFRQKRYGVGGKEIDVYKFRSMRVTPPSAVVKQATPNDDRITRVGRFIRKSSLDELPQFVNVLQGSMSIVGPRPHAVQHNELYRKLIPGYMLRHKVKPGITGWAQVNGLRGETETIDKMRRRIQYDLVYISHWSVSFDVRIILRTALLVFKDTSAY
jgi:putative colanic acid biosysnthesis UDP-glucose lipid carrier transferase